VNLTLQFSFGRFGRPSSSISKRAASQHKISAI